jgi:SAM-dependent methyltransferase
MINSQDLTDAAAEAAEVIISKFDYSWAYFCQFRFALAVYQRVLMQNVQIQAPSLEIGINDGSSATIAHFGKPKFTFGGDMPEQNTFESMGLYVDPNFDAYENVIGMDAHEIPFADGSFNTVVTNDMLSYGVNRDKIVREMVRVLAPGGTIFLSETTANLQKYPHLLAEVREVVPTVNTLEDPLSFYRETLGALGMTEISGRTFFDHRLCALVYGNLRRGEVSNPIDERKRGFYNESLRALASLFAADLAGDDLGQGWQVYITCKKPGVLRDLPTPKPVCLSCRAALTITLDTCACPNCGIKYRSEFGNAYVLSDYGKTYSPKSATASSRNTQDVRDYLANIEKGLGTGRTGSNVRILGFDKSTRYIIQSLSQRNVPVSAIYSENPLFVGHEVFGVPIRPRDQLGGKGEPIIKSFFYESDEAHNHP